eukprot:CAMPEP_0168388336 /NCGR_PEP_ID=MMETSP0228-20121227/16400_1 /TAXON_ID=133427 /ORGANISM="Protoceratium reticulatum, Strain CCCM 535 (=CCMP 1889)" /LENGTH=241 /DNA_ID=CAMNT_0008401583 /DNA_START=164 /DNA_END=887 /DNA_ORIENTATION=-
MECDDIVALAKDFENRLRDKANTATKIAAIAGTAVAALLHTHPHLLVVAKLANWIRKLINHHTAAIGAKAAAAGNEEAGSDGQQLEKWVEKEVAEATEQHRSMTHTTSKTALLAAYCLTAVSVGSGGADGGAGLHLATEALAATNDVQLASTVNLQKTKVEALLLLQQCISEKCPDASAEPVALSIMQSGSVRKRRLPSGGKPRPGQQGSLLQEGDWPASLASASTATTPAPAPGGGGERS